MQQLKSYMDKSKAAETQEEWAAIFGISRSHLADILRGAVKPGRKTIEKIAAATKGRVPPAAWFQKDRDAA